MNRRPPMLLDRNSPAVPLMILALTVWFAGRELPQGSPDKAKGPLLAAEATPAPQPASTPAAPAQAAPPRPIVDIFAVRSWEPPPPPVPAAEEGPPQPPPLPFQYLGRIADPGRPDVFLLLQGERIRHVRVGDRIGRDYRLEKFDRGRLVFRYRPMNATQTLAVGNRS